MSRDDRRCAHCGLPRDAHRVRVRAQTGAVTAISLVCPVGFVTAFKP